MENTTLNDGQVLLESGGSKVGNWLVGITYISTPIFFLTLYYFIMKLFATDSDLKHSQSYRIMFHLGIADMNQLSMQIMAGLFSIYNITANVWINKIVGAIANANWLAYVSLTFLLALNRMFIICLPHNFQTVFDQRWTSAWLTICWAWFVFWMGSYLSPFVDLVYFADDYSFGYAGKMANFFKKLEFFTCAAQLCAAGVFYTIILCYVLAKTNKLSNNANQNQEMRKEIRIFVQAVLISCYSTVLMICWHNYAFFLPDTKWTYFTLNVGWILNGGVNPFIYLVFNKTIRRKLLKRKARVVPGTSIVQNSIVHVGNLNSEDRAFSNRRTSVRNNRETNQLAVGHR